MKKYNQYLGQKLSFDELVAYCHQPASDMEIP